MYVCVWVRAQRCFLQSSHTHTHTHVRWAQWMMGHEKNSAQHLPGKTISRRPNSFLQCPPGRLRKCVCFFGGGWVGGGCGWVSVCVFVCFSVSFVCLCVVVCVCLLVCAHSCVRAGGRVCAHTLMFGCESLSPCSLLHIASPGKFT